MTGSLVRIMIGMALILAAPLPARAAPQISNAATRLNLDRCLEVSRSDQGFGGDAFRCHGFKNRAEYDVYVFEEDDRFFVSYGPDAFDLKAASQTLTPYNKIGDDIEWLLERRGGDWEPFATILRYFTEVEEDGGYYRGEVIVVSKIARGAACHAIYIDARANANANRLAREAADMIVRRFDCATQDPIIYGERGKSLGPTS